MHAYIVTWSRSVVYVLRSVVYVLKTMGKHGLRKRLHVVPLTTETESGVEIHVNWVPIVDLSCASRVFLRVLRFFSLTKINTSRHYGPTVIGLYLK